MRFAAPGTVRLDDCPPVAADIAPSPGAAARIVTQKRCRISPRLWPQPPETSFEPSDPYVRMYWTAALGPSAVAELLRVICAAKRSWSIPHPLFLPVLCEEGLVHYVERTVWVREQVPPLGRRQLARLSPHLQRRHNQDLATARKAARST